jgi:PRC-barrel domain
MEVRDLAGARIGTVEDAYVDAQGSYVRYVAITTGWFGTKRHMIPIDDVHMRRDGGESYLVVPYGKDLLRTGPVYERDEDFTRAQEERVYGHYGRAGYWDAVRAHRPMLAPGPDRVAVTRWGV